MVIKIALLIHKKGLEFSVPIDLYVFVSSDNGFNSSKVK